MNDDLKEKPSVISVILSVYNGGNYLKLSIESVLKQSFKAFEFLIMDDCSTDESLAYLENINDSRIKLFKQEKNQGLFTCLNALITKSNTGLVKLWSQDDIMFENCLQEVVSFHKKYPGLGFSYTGREMIDEIGNVRVIEEIDTTPEIISTTLHSHIAYHTGSIAGNIANVCINKKALKKVGLFNDKMKISADFDMWVRLAEHHITGFIREKLIQLRDHSGQLSRNEKYYINHVKEDLAVFTYLNSYVSTKQKKEGRREMRNTKLIFYYTLMLKTLFKGNLSDFLDYYKTLSSYDSFFVLSWHFIKVKIFNNRKFFKISEV